MVDFFKEIMKNALKEMISKLSKELIKKAIGYLILWIIGYYMKKNKIIKNIKKKNLKKFFF